MTQRDKKIDEWIDKIDKVLFGNGEKGICERVRNLEWMAGWPLKILLVLSLLLGTVSSVLAIIKYLNP